MDDSPIVINDHMNVYFNIDLSKVKSICAHSNEKEKEMEKCLRGSYNLEPEKEMQIIVWFLLSIFF